jgi:hypothetical protein
VHLSILMHVCRVSCVIGYHDHSKLGIVAKVTLVQKNVCVRTFNNTDNREKEIKKRKSEERMRKRERKKKV